MIDPKAKVDLRAIVLNELEKRKWTQVELAMMLDIKKQGLNAYLKGKSGLPYEKVERLLQVLDLLKDEVRCE